MSGVTPNFGPTTGGTSITVNGNNFRPGAIAALALNACTSIVVVSSSALTCNTPPGAVGSADVTVTNIDTSSGTLANGFQYQGSGGGGGTTAGPAFYSVMIDGGAPGVAWSYGSGPTTVPACDTSGGILNNTGGTGDPNSEACFLNQFKLDMCYLNQNHFGSAAYLKWNSTTHSWTSPTDPIVYYFPKENGTSTFWDNLRSQLHTWDSNLSANCPAGLGAGLSNGAPQLITEDNFSKPSVDGAFNWVNPLTWNATTNCTAQGGTGSQYCWNGTSNNYIDNFYTNAQANATMFATGAGKKGFDDNNASWGSNRVMAQQCGKVWMNTWAKVAAAGYSSSTQLDAIGIPTWNDYEEGTEIETGIDPCYRVGTPTITSNILSWSATTNDSTYAPLASGVPSNNTVAYWQVLACSTSNTNCIVAVDNIPIITFSTSLSSLVAGNYHIYVRLVGQPSIWNVTSAAVNYTASGSGGGTGGSTGFTDSFNTGSLSSLWTIDTGTAPGNIGGVNSGSFSSSYVDLSGGLLRLKVTQSGAGPVISTGAEVRSVSRYGYGTYTWNMRMASTATTSTGAGTLTSGQVSSSFLYFQNPSPLTEIDAPEVEGQAVGGNPAGKTLEYTSWTNGVVDTNTNVLASAQPDQGFHIYKTIWAPTAITYCVDGVQVAQHTTNIPTQAAYILVNLWGTNSTGFGGLADTIDTRYMYISSISYSTSYAGGC